MDGRNEQTEMSEVNIRISSSLGTTGRQKTMDGRNEQTEMSEVNIRISSSLGTTGRQKTMDGRNEQTEMSEVNIRISPSLGITWSLKSPMEMEMDGRNVQSEIEDQSLIVDIKDMEDKLRKVSGISEDCLIYRVPKHLRDTNEAAYVPRLVSLGPFHHGKEGLEAMEDHKWRCLESFIEEHDLDLGALLRLVKGHEKTTRGFYAERILLPSKQFVEVILVDAIFIINFLLQLNSLDSAIHVGSICHDDFFRREVSRDMMLLENQLPLFILEEIQNFVIEVKNIGLAAMFSFTVCELSVRLIDVRMAKEGSVTELINSVLWGRMGEWIRSKSKVIDGNSYDNARHFVDLQTLLCMPETRCDGKFERIKSISKLHKAGVRLEPASGKYLLDINFKDGKLEIPPIFVSSLTETIFRNLLAYDQCHRGSSCMSDYFVLMGMLIDKADDVELLVKNNILQNDLPTEEDVSKVFNNLEKEVIIYQDSFYYSDLCDKINKYCKKRRHRWMATLKQNYLDTPWKVISLIAAFILLVLTMIQTVFSVI